jgi:hypothetical protein
LGNQITDVKKAISNPSNINVNESKEPLISSVAVEKPVVVEEKELIILLEEPVLLEKPVEELIIPHTKEFVLVYKEGEKPLRVMPEVIQPKLLKPKVHHPIDITITKPTVNSTPEKPIEPVVLEKKGGPAVKGKRIIPEAQLKKPAPVKPAPVKPAPVKFKLDPNSANANWEQYIIKNMVVIDPVTNNVIDPFTIDVSQYKIGIKDPYDNLDRLSPQGKANLLRFQNYMDKTLSIKTAASEAEYKDYLNTNKIKA